ncbi:MAG TPA: amidophosphoribosyltransferase, partial [Planctomycetaceae bacterium]|nr:amidophosphoribosyltransferase [Planctomycetaceae bacterium]
GIDMSTVSELFAPRFMDGHTMTPEIERKMAAAIGAESLRYLPREAVARCLDKPAEALCQACINGVYPTAAGDRLYQIALNNAQSERSAAAGRTYDAPLAASASP